MVNIHIRNIPDGVAETIRVLAAKAGKSRNDYVVDLLTAITTDTDVLLLGFVQLDIPGDITDCSECGQPMRSVYVGLYSDGRVGDPVCFVCADEYA